MLRNMPCACFVFGNCTSFLDFRSLLRCPIKTRLVAKGCEKCTSFSRFPHRNAYCLLAKCMWFNHVAMKCCWL